MENKTIAVIAAAVVIAIAAFVLFNPFKTPAAQAKCVEGDKKNYSCASNSTLAWRECVQNEWLDNVKRCEATYCLQPKKGDAQCHESAASASASPSASPSAKRKGTPPSGVRPSPSPGAAGYEPGVMKCGDGVCDPTESCGACVADCGCDETQYCAESGVCVALLSCGDDNCTPQEKENALCCSDCGCAAAGEFCNEYLQKCSAPANVDEEQVTAEAAAFAERNGFALGEYSVEDSWWGNESVKLVTVHCAQGDEELQYECGGQLVVFENGTMLDFLFT